MKGQGVWADLIRQRFARAGARLGFNSQRIQLDLSKFRRPGPEGQDELF
jgi:hypothetical protein